MNFFDAYDVPGTSTPPPVDQPQPSLNEEVTQVVGQLSRFWGGFRKQSQTAFEAARKDLGQVVQQAQKELTKLAAEAPTPTQEQEPEPPVSAVDQAGSVPVEAGETTSVPSTSVKIDTDRDPNKPPSELEKASTTSTSHSTEPQSLFSRLQSSLPPSLVNTLQQAQLPESLKDTLQQARSGSANLTALDFAQLRSTIATELQRVQGATGEYVHRSEEFLREAGEFLKDAVKVVPPEEGDSVYPGLIWDGTDVWMLPTTSGVSPTAPEDGKGKGKEREGSDSQRPSIDTLRAVATRAESMLKQLRHDPEVLKADPKSDDNVRDMYITWLSAEAASEDRGLGTTAWHNRVERALADPVDGGALKITMDAIVPETLTQDEFWTRYFFRVYQVEREEARRKAIIQGTTENEDDFSWEDDEDETAPPTIKAAPQATVAPASTTTASVTHLTASAPDSKSRVSTPGHSSPRQSSEDSYDVVSSRVSSNGAAETETIKSQTIERTRPASGDEENEDEEGDDDEEEEEEEDEDDEDEDEDEEGEDSDWE